MDLTIKTEMYRNPEFKSVMEFGVTAIKELDDELIFQIILDGMDTLIENQDEALAYLDTIRKYLIEYSEEEGHTSARTAFILYKSD